MSFVERPELFTPPPDEAFTRNVRRRLTMSQTISHANAARLIGTFGENFRPVISCNSVGLNAMVPVAVGGGTSLGQGIVEVDVVAVFGTIIMVIRVVTLKTHTSSAAPKGTSSNVRGTSSSCGKRKPQPQLDSYGFQMQRESDARNVRTRCSTDCTDTMASGNDNGNLLKGNRSSKNIMLCSNNLKYEFQDIYMALSQRLTICNDILYTLSVLQFDMCALQHVTLENLESLEIVSVSKELLFSMSLHSSKTKKNLLFSTTNDEGCRSIRNETPTTTASISDTITQVLTQYRYDPLTLIGPKIAAWCLFVFVTDGTSSPLKSQQELCESASLSKEIKKFAECLQQCVVARNIRSLGKRPPSTTSFPHAYVEGGGAPPATNQTISIDRNIRRRLTTTPSHNTVDATALLAPSKLHVHTDLMSKDAVT
ncbi:hypothetical protein Tco_0736307 [Tanacetum coccineum]